ncbi:oxidoreductase [Musicola paradisiaca]|uniref:Short-chain dehydrogenase/reductase SDR n=1 Tax=Musicola paradisiaca (strain Ech703) TaxID=579405 RepID=C6C3Q1_MUSP7|nr:oxidoreductase [Musicola paradisiaca]ACS85396.1 short-chain dehydrogenase/reductase SDR [Musicola paradisiaca Ech703]
MSSHTGFTETDVPDQSGRCFVVTGANTGLGFEAACVLAARGARVILACRDKHKTLAAMEWIRSLTPAADLAFLHYDQADLDSIRRAAGELESEPRIDVLVNNAGVMNPPLARTQQGFELQFGVNHLGSFALTSLVLPLLSVRPNARVVITASLAHKTGQIDWSDINAERGYEKRPRYNTSKLANALFLFELDRRLRAAGSTVTAVGCHPGFATTDLGRHIPGIKLLQPLFGLISNTAAMGAWPTLHAATGPVHPGGYYGPQGFKEIRGVSGEASRAPQATDPAQARRLWDLSVSMTGIDPGLPPAP